VLKWKLDRLLDAYAYDLPKCGQTVVKLDSAVQGLKIALQAGNELITLRTLERDIQVRINEKSDSIASNSSVIHRAELKAARKKGNRKLVIGSVVGFILAVALHSF